MSETQTEKETEIVAGIIEGILQKGPDKWQVEVRPDNSNYTKKLWTKDSELVASLAQKITQAGMFACNASHWTNSEGKPVRSLWIAGEAEEGATPGVQNTPSTASGNAQTSAEKIAGIGQTVPAVDWDAKERRDYRSRAWAQTLGAFTHTIKVDEKPEDVFARLQPFQRKVFTDVCQSFAFPSTDADENLPF